MKTSYTVTLAMLAGFGLGSVAVQGLHAQAKPPVYYISEISVTDLDGYTKEYAPKVQAWRNSAEYKELRKIGDKYATFRAFAVEGVPQ